MPNYAEMSVKDLLRLKAWYERHVAPTDDMVVEYAAIIVELDGRVVS